MFKLVLLVFAFASMFLFVGAMTDEEMCQQMRHYLKMAEHDPGDGYSQGITKLILESSWWAEMQTHCPPSVARK